MQRIESWMAFDGNIFATEEEARDHENKCAFDAFEKLSTRQLPPMPYWGENDTIFVVECKSRADYEVMLAYARTQHYDGVLWEEPSPTAWKYVIIEHENRWVDVVEYHKFIERLTGFLEEAKNEIRAMQKHRRI